jgi:hypothetical protein
MTGTPVQSNPAVDSAIKSSNACEPTKWSGDIAALFCLALATVIIHLLTGGRYGFHRDELATLEDARHLAWGYVAYPPITPFFARLSLEMFGTSLAGFRLFAALAQAASVVLTGLIARELGARRSAQLLAASAYIPFCLAAGALMQYVSFDNLFWVLTAYFVVKLCKSGDPRWWVAVGAAIGLGMMAKYGIVFLVAGVVVAVLATDLRKHLASKWLWIGVGVSLLVFLPNLIWQAQHGFITLEFLRNIHARDVRIGRTKDFLPDQLKMTLLATPLWLAGLYYSLISPRGKGFRAIGWMYVVPLVLFVVAKGRGYYLAAAYPMLYAAGATWLQNSLDAIRRGWANTIRAVAWTALAANMLLIIALVLPTAPPNTKWWRAAMEINGDLREQFGWQELTHTVAQIRDSLPAQDRAQLGIMAGNYGEAGAINLYGPQYGLPTAISGINSFWQRGYGTPPPQTLIVIGIGGKFLDRNFTQCEVAAHTWNVYGVMNEETRDHQDIYVCRGLRQSWPEFWKDFHYFG